MALGYELTPDYHERTRLMGVQNFMGQLAYLLSPWFLWIMAYEPLHADLRIGAGSLGIAVGIFTIAVGILPAIFLRERYKEPPPNAASEVAKVGGKKELEQLSITAKMLENTRDFLKGFATTLKFRPFLKLCAATFLVFNGFMLVASFQFYVIIYYVFGGDQEQGALYAGWAGSLSAVSTFCVIFFTTWLATKIGKRRAFFFTTYQAQPKMILGRPPPEHQTQFEYTLFTLRRRLRINAGLLISSVHMSQYLRDQLRLLNAGNHA